MNQVVIDAVKAHLAQLKARSLELQEWIDETENRVAPKKADRRLKTVGGRHLSPEARKRIADAQKKRWSEFRKKKVA